MESWSDLFAACAPGLEPIAAQELRQLGLKDAHLTPGGVECRGSRRDLYRLNLHLRTADRVLMRIGDFYAAAFSELRKKAARLDWPSFLRPDRPLAIKATCHKSKLYHSDAVVERVLGAIEDRLGRAVARASGGEESAAEAQWVMVRLVHDRCTISIDTSGELLHRRGYRLATAKAPLRETLAAGVLIAAGWDKTSPLLDPFCGSGTLAIEAALLAANRTPGAFRRFAFMEWPDFDAPLWASLLAEAEANVSATSPIILASDRDAGAIENARANAGRAGVADRIEFTRRSLSAIEPPQQRGWVIANPPYGLRVSRDRDLRDLYAQFGRVMRDRCAGWHVALLCPDAHLAGHSRLPLRTIALLTHGGLKVKLLAGEIP